MLLRSLFRSALCLLVLATGLMMVMRPAVADSDRVDSKTVLTDESTDQFVTYARQYGETYFAMTLAAPEELPLAKSTDVLVLFDTSASQTGVYRDDALATLQSFLSEINGAARVKLAAVDVQPIQLTKEFVAPDSDAMKSAVKSLHRRAPLGSTDMAAAMRYAGQAFDQESKAPRAVVYMGDGLSRMNMLQTEELRAFVEDLAKNHIAVSSFAIGPQRDLILLASLANHTGGNVFVDGNNVSPQQAGLAVAGIALEPVIWPTDVSMTDNFVEVYPEQFPPLRGDRTSVVIGAIDGPGDHRVELTGRTHAGEVTWKWDLNPAASSVDNAFLAPLVDTARKDSGLTLATIGNRSLDLMRHVAVDGARDLTELSSRALASGDYAGAKRLAEAALNVDPASTIAETVRDAAKHETGSQGNPGAPGEAGVRGESTVRLAAYQPPGGGLLDEVVAEQAALDGAFLDAEEDRKRLQTEVIRAEVEFGLGRARELFDVDPQGAIADLKVLLENVERAPDLEAEVRAQLRDQIVTAIKEGQRRQIEKDERDQLRAERQAAAQERERIIREAERREEKIKQIIARYNSLMDEWRFREAEEAAYEARALSSGSPFIVPQPISFDHQTTIAAIHTARMSGYVNDIMQIREARQKGVVDALFQVERAHVPFADEPPITYPDPQVWEELTLRRKKYASIDLAKRGGAEEQIFEALNDSTTLEFIETPLQDVVDYLKDLHGIEIQIDHRALEDIGIGSDTPITRNLKGITLRSALRLMLKEMDLTYVVRDEVLLITTPEEAESELTTKVYPVADLVLPISSGAGANPFSLGGGVQGQGGFGGGLGGGGAGQAGGGLGGGGLFGGGGGGGLGGGGGVFAVEDEIRLGSKDAQTETKKPTEAAPARPVFQPQRRSDSKVRTKPQRIELSDAAAKEANLQDAWDAHFKSKQSKPDATADVRETARQLMAEEKFDELVAFIQGALKHGQPQPWMYEALFLALQAGDAPQADLERALLSAVDFSDNPLDLMYVAAYMGRSAGMEELALRLFHEVAQSYPSQPQAFIQAMEIADRIGDDEAAQWACLGVLRQAWPVDQRRLEDKARRLAIAVLHRLEKEGQAEEAKRFHNELNLAMIRDVVVEVTWTGDADVDVLVEEPSGTVCSFRNPRTTAGGVILGDTASRDDQNSVEGYSESYVCSEAFPGQYRILMRRIWGEVTAGTVNVKIYKNYKTKQQEVVEGEIPLGEKDAVLMVDLEKGRRTEAMADHQLAAAAQTHVAISRAVLAQQLNSVTNSDAVRDFERDRRIAARDGRLGFRRRGSVGFQPLITTLPEGANMTSTAVISADRRYVRITAVPIFSFIGEVNTFNIRDGTTENITDTIRGDGDMMDMMDMMDIAPPPFRG